MRHHSVRQSLRLRLVLMLIAASGCTAAAVAVGSWWLGYRTAMSDLRDRFGAIKVALQQTTFPLAPPILESLSELTGARWMTASGQDTVERGIFDGRNDFAIRGDSGTRASPEISAAQLRGLPDSEGGANPPEVRIASTAYFAFRFTRFNAPSEALGGERVYVLYEKSRIDAAARRAAVLPLLTGLSTVLAVSVMVYFITSRWIGRLSRLETQVGRIATGDFNSQVSETGGDELGRLAEAINTMTEQLRSLWNNVNQQQSAKLLHQVSAGMAHQLRNTLTGARMAMELHQDRCEGEGPDEVRVAIRQLELAEDYVHRLLALGANASSRPRPLMIKDCIADVCSTHRSIADHLGVDLRWAIEPTVNDQIVHDGPAFSAAVSNLVLNALDSGTHVDVSVSIDPPDRCLVRVSDDGEGIDEGMRDALFEPFVTSKPEGMGLGLSLVRRTAEALGGSVTWKRDGDRTVFDFCVSCERGPEA